MLETAHDAEVKNLQRKQIVIVVVMFSYIFTSLGLFLVDTIVFQGAGLDQIYLGILLGILVLFPTCGFFTVRISRRLKTLLPTPAPSRKKVIFQVILAAALLISVTVVIISGFLPT